MADFNYFGTMAEFAEFLHNALNDGYCVIMKKRAPTATLESCANVSAIDLAIAQRQYAFLLTRNDITRFPVGMVSFVRDGVQFWNAYPPEGGPVIEVYYCAPYEEEGRRIVPCWLLAYQSRIISPETDQYEPAGDAIKKEFNAMIAPLRKRAKKVKSIKRTAYVSPGVMSLLESGYILAKPFDGYKVGP